MTANLDSSEELDKLVRIKRQIATTLFVLMWALRLVIVAFLCFVVMQ